MRKKLHLLCMLLLLIALAYPIAVEASAFREVKQVAQTVELKANASPNAKTITTLQKQALVTQFSTVTGGWSYVQANQYKGYVATSALQTPASAIKIASSKSGLVVKETATRSSKTVANLTYNMIVEDFGTVGGGWSFVQYGNVTGYVNSAFINIAQTATRYVATETVVRNIASPSGVMKAVLQPSTTVTVHSQIAGWSYVTAGNVRGYVPTRELTTTKPVVKPQTLQSFSDLRPLGLRTMTYFIDITSEHKASVYHGDIIHSRYDNEHHYETISKASDEGGIYQIYTPTTYVIGMPETDWLWYRIDAPMVQHEPTPVIRYGYGDGDEDERIGSDYLRSKTATLTTPAGTFTNVIHIERKLYNSTSTTHFYFAQDYGLLKIEASTGKLLFELRSYE